MFVALAVVAAHSPAAAAVAGDRPGRALFEQAETKFNLGRFEEALADYQAAYEVEPLPAFLFNIAQCHRNLGDYERAKFFFRRYTTLDPRSPNRAAAERLIVEMDKLAAGQVGEGERAPEASTASLAVPPPAPASAQSERSTSANATAFAPVVQHRSNDTASPPIYRRTWFWIGVAAVAVAGVAAGYVIARDDPQPSLGTIDVR
jgi:tetratricopeptide (TPR) repeat protein